MRNKLNTCTLSYNAFFFYSEIKNLFKNPNEPEFVLITIRVKTCLGQQGKMQVLTRGLLLYLKVIRN